MRQLDGVVIDTAALFNYKLQEWETLHNYAGPHGSLNGQTPYERLRQKTPTSVQSVIVSFATAEGGVCEGDSNPRMPAPRGFSIATKGVRGVFGNPPS